MDRCEAGLGFGGGSEPQLSTLRSPEESTDYGSEWSDRTLECKLQTVSSPLTPQPVRMIFFKFVSKVVLLRGGINPKNKLQQLIIIIHITGIINNVCWVLVTNGSVLAAASA